MYFNTLSTATDYGMKSNWHNNVISDEESLQRALKNKQIVYYQEGVRDCVEVMEQFLPRYIQALAVPEHVDRISRFRPQFAKFVVDQQLIYRPSVLKGAFRYGYTGIPAVQYAIEGTWKSMFDVIYHHIILDPSLDDEFPNTLPIAFLSAPTNGRSNVNLPALVLPAGWRDVFNVMLENSPAQRVADLLKRLVVEKKFVSIEFLKDSLTQVEFDTIADLIDLDLLAEGDLLTGKVGRPDFSYGYDFVTTLPEEHPLVQVTCGYSERKPRRVKVYVPPLNVESKELYKSHSDSESLIEILEAFVSDGPKTFKEIKKELSLTSQKLSKLLESSPLFVTRHGMVQKVKDNECPEVSAVINCIYCNDIVSKGLVNFLEVAVRGPSEKKEFLTKASYKGKMVIGVGSTKKKSKAAARTYLLHGDCNNCSDFIFKPGEHTKEQNIQTFDPEYAFAYSEDTFDPGSKYSYKSKGEVKSSLVNSTNRELILAKQSKVLYEALIRYETKKKNSKQIDNYCINCSNYLDYLCQCSCMLCRRCDVRCDVCTEPLIHGSDHTGDFTTFERDVEKIVKSYNGIMAKDIKKLMFSRGYEKEGLKKEINRFLYDNEELFYQDFDAQWFSLPQTGWC
jgi:hypothetical protein